VEFEEALRVLAALEREGVRYVLVGSMAMAAQGLIRATRDIDFFVAPDADNVAALRRALASVFEGDSSIEEITAEDLGGDYPAIQYTPPHALYTIDLLARLGERFAFDDIESETLDIEGVPVVVATPRMLYRMKKDTARPQDRADAEALRQQFELDEED
jgi:hypothetical protein